MQADVILKEPHPLGCPPSGGALVEGMNSYFSRNEQKMFNCTKAKSVCKNEVRTNEHILVQMNKKMFNRTTI